MNEPSVFETEQGTLPLQTIHMRTDGTIVRHRDIHSAYGSLMQKASYKGCLARDNYERRAFVMSRSFFIGAQKFGPFWTGDNAAKLEDVTTSVGMMLSMGLTGSFFGGSDIPGYNGDPPQDLYIMFYQVGIFYPFMRAHCWIAYGSREPWIQSNGVQHVIRESVYLKYNLIHYTYTAFKHGNMTGMPLMRPMFLEYPSEES